MNAKKLKSDNPKLYKDIRGENYNLRDVKIVLGQDCYKLHHASETSFIPGNESLPMKATSQLGVALCGAIESKYTIEGNSTIAFTSINEVRKSEPDRYDDYSLLHPVGTARMSPECINGPAVSQLTNVKNNRDDWNWNIAVRKPIDDYCANDRTGVFKIENRAGDVGNTNQRIKSDTKTLDNQNF